jgi:hypothetical protein
MEISGENESYVKLYKYKVESKSKRGNEYVIILLGIT